MNVLLEDISKRIRTKNSFTTTKSQFNVNNIELYNDKRLFNENNAFYIINHWTELSENTNIAFDKALDVFSEICENCNNNKVSEACDILLQEINKVRDAVQLQNSIKHKTSRLKTKITTKIQNKVDSASNALANPLANIQNKLKPVLPSSKPKADNDTVEESFNKLYDKASVLVECDRILNNYNKICKRFDITKIMSEVSCEYSIYEAINEICACIDTYNIPFINKYNTSLETCSYALQKNYLQYPPEKIIEAVTDYYIFNTCMESCIDDVKKISKSSPLFKESDFDSVSYLYKEQQNTDEKINITSPEYGVKNICEDINDIKISGRVIRNDIAQWKYGNPHEHADDDIKDMINDFRSKCAKLDKDDNKNVLISQFKALLTKLYTKNPEQITQELPKLLTLIRMTFVISTCAINVVIGLIAFITDQFIKLTLSRKETERIVSAYKKEIENTTNKLNKTKDDYTKERLEKYKKELEKDLEKIKDYESNLYSDEENDKRNDDNDYKFDNDFDFDFDDDDDFGLSESQLINCATISIISELMQSLSEANIEDVDGMVANNLYKVSDDTIDTITDFSITVPTILEKKKLYETFKSYKEQLMKAEYKDYTRISTINENMYKLKNSTNVYNTNIDSKSIICSLMWLNELAILNNNTGYVNEMNITNTLKLALNRLKNTAMKLSDKEKQMSNTIDTSVNNMSKSIEKAMMNDSRESIIRGSILPSASKTIKMALVLGAEWALNPALAVITALGAFACQKRLSAKERQLALDDIEIELKMCERYMRQAEDKNDMKAIRNIEQIQRNLERQQQRIKYRMKVIYNQDVPNAPGDND